MDYIADIAFGSSIPLPDYWIIYNTPNSSEEYTNIRITNQDVTPHKSAIKVIDNAIDKKDNIFGVSIITRYHMAFDGEWHFSFNFPNNHGTFGFVWRYIDRFTHYGCRI